MALLRRLTGEQKRTVAHWGMELVIVVAGVLIALWVQQWADRRRLDADVRAAEEAMHAEVRGVLTALIWRDAISRCHADRVRLLKTMLMKEDRRWPGLTENALLENTLTEASGVESIVPGVYQRPSDDFDVAAWNSALATGVLNHMDRERFEKIQAVYRQIAFLEDTREREDRAAAVLSALALPQDLSADTRTRMYQALYELDSTRFIFGFIGTRELVDSMRGLGWVDKAEIDRWIVNERALDADRKTKWRPCVRRERNPFDEAPDQAAAA